MSNLTENQTRQLSAIAGAEDLMEARRLCDQFLRATVADIPLSREPQSPEDILAGLLEGTLLPVETAPRRFEKFTGRIYKSYAVAVLSSDAGVHRYDEALEQIKSMPDTWCMTYQNRLICVTASTKFSANYSEFHGVAKKQGLSGGISRPFENLATLRNAYQQAVATLKTLRILDRKCTIACYDDYLMIRLLDGMREDVDLGEFCMPDIQVLQDYDKKHDAELCRTLLCYLEHAKNVTGTARELNVHRNTVHYRINKCAEILNNLDFSNDYITFLLMLSLHIGEYEYYRQMRVKAQSTL